MGNAVENVIQDSPEIARPEFGLSCFHCGQQCGGAEFINKGKRFCCNGCLTVHELLTENGLGHYYDLRPHPGLRIEAIEQEKWLYLDQPEVFRQLVDYSDPKITRLSFQIPAIHCIACVWLLENLFQLHPAIGRCRVNFSRREAAITFSTDKIKLSELVALLTSIGYEPELNLGQLRRPPTQSSRKNEWLQIGLAGFAFGNTMLLSLPLYLGLDSLNGRAFEILSGTLNLILALPVVIYSASDYWRSASLAIRNRFITLDVPIAIGLATIYGQSAFEIISGTGAGYCDSLTGLIFLLLCGRMFQKATYDRITFDRDYKYFFPLSVVRKTGNDEQAIPISQVRKGDRLLVRNGELVAADARLASSRALLDYSFVTGESSPVEKVEGDYLFAGGKQIGAAIEVETLKSVSQSYLTSLWNEEIFKKENESHLDTLTNRYGKRFTWIVLGIAAASGLFWCLSGNSARAIKAFISILIVACPCALALAAPFALGTAHRLLVKGHVFLKNAFVLERMAQVDTVVFDKTGTLTSRSSEARFFGAQGVHLPTEEMQAIRSLAKHSTHPHAIQISSALDNGQREMKVDAFQEVTGCGIIGEASGYKLLLGSQLWLEKHGVTIPNLDFAQTSGSYLAINGIFKGIFLLSNEIRPDIEQLFAQLQDTYDVALISGDNDGERNRFQQFFSKDTELRFHQTPFDKLCFIRNLQQAGKVVMMVGDGLNDAGALKQSDVGVAVVENITAFSPASDAILEAGNIFRLAHILRFARKTSRIVHLSFGLSAAYNVIGIGIAAAGLLSPLVCAVLMPLSSVSVVLFACGLTKFTAAREHLGISDFKTEEPHR